MALSSERAPQEERNNPDKDGGHCPCPDVPRQGVRVPPINSLLFVRSSRNTRTGAIRAPLTTCAATAMKFNGRFGTRTIRAAKTTPPM